MTRDIEMMIERTRPIIRGRTRFFIVKSFSPESLEISQTHQVWATSPGPTKKLTNAFKTADHVILIFSVNESRSFQGFALMESEPDMNYKKEFFQSDPNSMIQFAGNFKVRWIIQGDYQFKDLEYFPPNPMNEMLPIKQSKNGQELPFKLGNYLSYLLYNQKDPQKKIITSLEIINQMPLQFNPNRPQPQQQTSQNNPTQSQQSITQQNTYQNQRYQQNQPSAQSQGQRQGYQQNYQSSNSEQQQQHPSSQPQQQYVPKRTQAYQVQNQDYDKQSYHSANSNSTSGGGNFGNNQYYSQSISNQQQLQ